MSENPETVKPDRQGRLEGSTPITIPPGEDPYKINDTFRRIADEKKQADKAIALGLGKIWPAITFLGSPTVAGLITPSVAEQRTFFGVFLATLAFSSGVAAFYFIVATKALGDIGGVGLFTAAAICFMAGSLFSIGVGHGFYDVDIPFGKYGSTPPGWVLPFIDAAISTFGPLGAMLGAVSGMVAGRWGSITYRAMNGQ